jgi:tryptophan-rich sensory protein
MKNILIPFIIFLVINFGALGIGGIFTGQGVPSDWYQNLNKAPWTPPGWVFGAAWTTIMLCFAVFMAVLWNATDNKAMLIALFSIQWVLNVLWSPVFFKYHELFWGLLIISLLLFLVGFFLFAYIKQVKAFAFLVLPYFVWLLIASSLNAYAWLKN